MSGEEKGKPGGRVIRASIRTSASPEEAWKAWADPERIAHWFVDRAKGEPRPGTTFTWFFDKFGYEIPYEVVAAEPNRRFALGGSAPGRGPFLLDITIRTEAGQTVVELVNSGFLEGAEWDDEYEGVVSGWKNALAVLKVYLEQYPGRAKRMVLLMRPAVFEYGRLLSFYATAEGLSRWLTSGGSIGKVGEPVALTLSSGEPLHGLVLVNSGREVTLSWEEVSGTIELKAFSFGPGRRMVGVRILSWQAPPEKLEALEAFFSAALDRLVAIL